MNTSVFHPRISNNVYYMFKVNNRNTTSRCEICSQLTINIPERHQWVHSGVFIVNFEHISYLITNEITISQKDFASSKLSKRALCETCSKLVVKITVTSVFYLIFE